MKSNSLLPQFTSSIYITRQLQKFSIRFFQIFLYQIESNFPPLQFIITSSVPWFTNFSFILSHNNNTNTNSFSNKSISVSNSMSLFLNTCITLRGAIPLDFFLSFFLITNSRFKFYRNENSSIVKRSCVRREEDRDCANGASHERVCVRSRNFRQAEKKVGRKEGARA